MLSIGVLFDFFINLAKVLSGDGGIVTAFCLYFLVTTSIRGIGEGCAVSSFGEFLGLVKRCPSNRFIAIFGHVAIGIVSVGSVLVAGIDS